MTPRRCAGRRSQGSRVRRRPGSFGIKFLVMDDVAGLPAVAPRAAS